MSEVVPVAFDPGHNSDPLLESDLLASQIWNFGSDYQYCLAKLRQGHCGDIGPLGPVVRVQSQLLRTIPPKRKLAHVCRSQSSGEAVSRIVLAWDMSPFGFWYQGGDLGYSIADEHCQL